VVCVWFNNDRIRVSIVAVSAPLAEVRITKLSGGRNKHAVNEPVRSH
jgi:hypothetical protein